jgi:uncharacterized protein YaiL (DUF2058 family)
MSESLQDQLLDLGLASKKPKKCRGSSSRAGPKAPKRPGGGNSPPNKNNQKRNDRAQQAAGGEVSLDRAYALRKQEEQKQADTARKRKQEEDRRRRQLNREIKAIVSKHRMNDAAAEIPRNFMYRGRIRKINLTPIQLKALNAGEAGVVYLSGGYHLLAPEHVEAVRKLSGDHVPDLAAGATEDEKGFPVPDDLIW